MDLSVCSCVQLIVLYPDIARLFTLRSMCATKKRAYKAGLKDAKRAIELNPKEGKAYYWAGVSAAADGKYKVAAGYSQVSFQWKNPDVLLKNLDLLIRNLDFLLKNVGFIITTDGARDGSFLPGQHSPVHTGELAVSQRPAVPPDCDGATDEAACSTPRPETTDARARAGAREGASPALAVSA